LCYTAQGADGDLHKGSTQGGYVLEQLLERWGTTGVDCCVKRRLTRVMTP
jgi:hypothetical protein